MNLWLNILFKTLVSMCPPFSEDELILVLVVHMGFLILKVPGMWNKNRFAAHMYTILYNQANQIEYILPKK